MKEVEDHNKLPHKTSRTVPEAKARANEMPDAHMQRTIGKMKQWKKAKKE